MELAGVEIGLTTVNQDARSDPILGYGDRIGRRPIGRRFSQRVGDAAGGLNSPHAEAEGCEKREDNTMEA